MRQERVAFANLLVVGEVAIADERSDEQAAVWGFGYLSEFEVGDVDEGGGLFDSVLHQVDKVGASAEEFGAFCGYGVEGFVGCGGALVGEGVHAETPDLPLREAARTAATMLG